MGIYRRYAVRLSTSLAYAFWYRAWEAASPRW